MGDSVGITMVTKNDTYGAFGLQRSYDESFEMRYKAIFIELDFSLLKVSVSHAYEGRELYEGEIKNNPGSGSFLSGQMKYQFYAGDTTGITIDVDGLSPA